MADDKKQGVGFPQKYNQEAPPRQDLNPDAVADSSVLPKPQRTDAPTTTRKPRGKAKK